MAGRDNDPASDTSASAESGWESTPASMRTQRAPQIERQQRPLRATAPKYTPFSVDTRGEA
ncbi:hypothetical protein E4U44_000447 [Claviceps purpurea]|nr:hypothetical protein E4U44_000447 [Claviceps purpurea]